MNSDSTSLLVTACFNGNISQVEALINDPSSIIDVNAFIIEIHYVLSLACIRKKSRATISPACGSAIGTVLIAYKDTVDAKVICEYFYILSSEAPAVVPIIVSLFAKELTSLVVNSILIDCKLQPNDTAIALITNCASKFNRGAIKRAFIICCKLQLPDLLKDLLDRYSQVIECFFVTVNPSAEPELLFTTDPFAEPESFFTGIAQFCHNSDAETARVFVNKYNQLAPHVLAASILTGDLDITELMFEEYGNLLTSTHINKGFDLACKRKDLDMMDLFVKYYGVPEAGILHADVIDRGYDSVYISCEPGEVNHIAVHFARLDDCDLIEYLCAFLGDNIKNALAPGSASYEKLLNTLGTRLLKLIPVLLA